MAIMKEGDWTCLSCNNHNYASRTVCNRCQGPKPPPPGENVRSGDWICPMCSNHNYARRQACNKCQTPKPGTMMQLAALAMYPGTMGTMGAMGVMGAMGPMSAMGNLGGNFRPGDWVCQKCANHNYSSREQCNKCSSPKMVSHAAYGAFKGAAGYAGRLSPYPAALPNSTKFAGSMRAGDWLCPGCGNHNYASREMCNKCQRPKNMPANFRDGDWICPKCSNHNYASKQACNKCQEPKPELGRDTRLA